MILPSKSKNDMPFLKVVVRTQPRNLIYLEHAIKPVRILVLCQKSHSKSTQFCFFLQNSRRKLHSASKTITEYPLRSVLTAIILLHHCA